MGLYWDTKFHKNESDEGILLNDGHFTSILENIENEFYDKTQFLEKFGHLVKEDDITELSYIEEYYWDTYGGSNLTKKYFSNI